MCANSALFLDPETWMSCICQVSQNILHAFILHSIPPDWALCVIEQLLHLLETFLVHEPCIDRQCHRLGMQASLLTSDPDYYFFNIFFSITDIYTLIDSWWVAAKWHRQPSLGLRDALEGWDWEGGREAQEEENIYIYIYIYTYNYDWFRVVVWQKPTQHCKAILL